MLCVTLLWMLVLINLIVPKFSKNNNYNDKKKDEHLNKINKMLNA